jgi:hypothetical protein
MSAISTPFIRPLGDTSEPRGDLLDALDGAQRLVDLAPAVGPQRDAGREELHACVDVAAGAVECVGVLVHSGYHIGVGDAAERVHERVIADDVAVVDAHCARLASIPVTQASMNRTPVWANMFGISSWQGLVRRPPGAAATAP